MTPTPTSLSQVDGNTSLDSSSSEESFVYSYDDERETTSGAIIDSIFDPPAEATTIGGGNNTGETSRHRDPDPDSSTESSPVLVIRPITPISPSSTSSEKALSTLTPPKNIHDSQEPKEEEAGNPNNPEVDGVEVAVKNEVSDLASTGSVPVARERVVNERDWNWGIPLQRLQEEEEEAALFQEWRRERAQKQQQEKEEKEKEKEKDGVKDSQFNGTAEGEIEQESKGPVTEDIRTSIVVPKPSIADILATIPDSEESDENSSLDESISSSSDDSDDETEAKEEKATRNGKGKERYQHPGSYGLKNTDVEVSACPSPAPIDDSSLVTPGNDILDKNKSDKDIYRQKRHDSAISSAEFALYLILEEEGVDPKSNLCTRLAQLFEIYRPEWPDSPVNHDPYLAICPVPVAPPALIPSVAPSQTTDPTTLNLLNKILGKLNDHSEMLNVIAEASGVDLLEDDDDEEESEEKTDTAKTRGITSEENSTPAETQQATLGIKHDRENLLSSIVDQLAKDKESSGNKNVDISEIKRNLKEGMELANRLNAAVSPEACKKHTNAKIPTAMDNKVVEKAAEKPVLPPWYPTPQPQIPLNPLPRPADQRGFAPYANNNFHAPPAFGQSVKLNAALNVNQQAAAGPLNHQPFLPYPIAPARPLPQVQAPAQGQHAQPQAQAVPQPQVRPAQAACGPCNPHVASPEAAPNGAANPAFGRAVYGIPPPAGPQETRAFPPLYPPDHPSVRYQPYYAGYPYPSPYAAGYYTVAPFVGDTRFVYPLQPAPSPYPFGFGNRG